MLFRVLGPVAVVGPGGPVPLKGVRQRAVLARLLVARGEVVPVDSLVDALWETPPAGAVGALRTFVGDLRRALEPSRAPREPASLLVTVAPGYALRVAAEALDAGRFEELARSGDPEVLGSALGLWSGPAYADHRDAGWARAEISRLEELRTLAVQRRAAALLAAGRVAEAVPVLRAQVETHPLREDGWRLLAVALYRAGRQGEALGALRRARELLREELGVDPGPELRRVEAAILAQDDRLAGPEVRSVEAWERRVAGPELGREGAGGSAQDDRLAEPETRRVDAAGSVRLSGDISEISDLGALGSGFVGRAEVLALLESAAGEGVGLAHAAGDGVGLALVAGDAGAGKSALAGELARRLARRGWVPVWARAAEHEGAAAVLPRVPEGVPVLLVADDLHRADGDLVEFLMRLLASRRRLLVVGTYRPEEVGAVLREALSRFAAREPVRVRLGGLGAREVAQVAAAIAGRAVPERVARVIHERSGGNPFYVRELARLHRSGAALEDIPDGVRDVIRHRASRLGERAREVLRRAAVLGRDVDPVVLAASVEGDVLDPLEEALGAGFLSEDTGLRFTHILVRDTLYGDLSAMRRARWHADAARALERERPDDAAALAHHWSHAPGQEGKAAGYAAVAAGSAERRNNPHEAARLWRQALAWETAQAGKDSRETARCKDDDGEACRRRVRALVGLGRAVAVTGGLGEARALRAEAIAVAARVGEAGVWGEALAGFEVPAVWPRNDDEGLSARVVAAVREALGRGGTDRRLRCRLLAVMAVEMRGDASGEGARAAQEAERLAREEGDAGLLAPALNARYLHTFWRAGLAAERERIGAELVAVASGGGLVTYEVLGHLIGMQSACARGDVAAADGHAGAADRLAERYELPTVAVFTGFYRALRLTLHDRPAGEAYQKCLNMLKKADMPGMERDVLALLEAADRAQWPLEGPDRAQRQLEGPDRAQRQFEGPAPAQRPLEAQRRPGAAPSARSSAQPEEEPRGLLREALLVHKAQSAIERGDREAMAGLYRELLPAAGELAGAGSGIVSLGPVVRVLTRLRSRIGFPPRP